MQWTRVPRLGVSQMYTHLFQSWRHYLCWLGYCFITLSHNCLLIVIITCWITWCTHFISTSELGFTNMASRDGDQVCVGSYTRYNWHFLFNYVSITFLSEHLWRPHNCSCQCFKCFRWFRGLVLFTVNDSRHWWRMHDVFVERVRNKSKSGIQLEFKPKTFWILVRYYWTLARGAEDKLHNIGVGSKFEV